MDDWIKELLGIKEPEDEDIEEEKPVHREGDHVVRCKHCGGLEWWGRMMWLNGQCSCRKCYKAQYERENGKPYPWDDLDGDPVPEEREASNA